jgi:hypothetical protein
MVVLTRDADQVKLVRRLFREEHRRQVYRGRRWQVWSLDNYKDIPLVKNAMEAYNKQYTLDGTLPVRHK